MGFVESIAGKLGHQVENLLNLLGWIFTLSRTFDEALALLRHLLGLFLSHGATEQVRFAQGISGQPVRDLHHLLLIHDHAQRFF